MKKLLVLFLLISGLFAAVGCDLNEPDRDVKRIFPQSTNYKTYYVSLKTPAQLQRVETKLGDKFKGLYETIDVPYTLYEVYAGKNKIGYIHGVNQKGVYGGIQVFLALDLTGTIKDFYIQKLTSKEAAFFRTKDFAKQFIGLNLNYFLTGKFKKADISSADYPAIIRAVRKNLILMDEFVYQKKGVI